MSVDADVDVRDDLDDHGAVEEADVVRRFDRIELEIAESVGKGSGKMPFEVIRSELAGARARGPEVENEWTLPDPFDQRLFVALCSRYSLHVYRRPKKRTFTVVVPAPSAFMRDVFRPVFDRMSEVIDEWLVECTESVLGVFAAPLPEEPEEL